MPSSTLRGIVPPGGNCPVAASFGDHCCMFRSICSIGLASLGTARDWAACPKTRAMSLGSWVQPVLKPYPQVWPILERSFASYRPGLHPFVALSVSPFIEENVLGCEQRYIIGCSFTVRPIAHTCVKPIRELSSKIERRGGTAGWTSSVFIFQIEWHIVLGRISDYQPKMPC